ncbi:MAG TPA: hypothetical protein VF035_02070 [Longimicrobiales bacterium]
MSAHILMAQGDVRAEARQLLEKLVADRRLDGNLPAVDQQGDSTVVVLDPEHESLIGDFEGIGFTRRREEDSY